MGILVGRRSKREGIYVNTELIQVVVWQRLTQHCKAVILQLKEKVFSTVPDALKRIQ